MSILWAGGEDMDFPIGSSIVVDNVGFRSGYARCSLHAGAYCKSISFGANTSIWLSFFLYNDRFSFNPVANTLVLGLVNGSTLASGLWIGISPTSDTQVAVFKYDGTTKTLLAAEPGNSAIAFSLLRMDMQVINYGVAGTVNVFINGSLVCTFTGDLTVSGVSTLDSVGLFGQPPSNAITEVSEIIVANEDTRAFGLVTMAPNAAGTTSNWTGLFTDVNEVVLNDATMINTSSVAQNEQFNLLDMPVGNYTIKAVAPTARATSTAGATATKVALGFNIGGTVSAGTAQTTTTAWKAFQQIYAINPVTGVNWILSDMNPLQLNLQSS